MNIHEYQAKEIFKCAGIPVSRGRMIERAEDAAVVFNELKTAQVVVKAQVHAGGRGKAGGIKFAKSAEEAIRVSREILGLKIKTKQTAGLEKIVRKVWIEASTEIQKEFYLAVTVDRTRELPCIIFSPAGGMSIEEVAEKNPDLIYQLHFEPDKLPTEVVTGSFIAPCVKGDDRRRELAQLLQKVARLFVEVDASLVEINPLALTTKGNFIAVDAKITFDDNALFRHADFEVLRDPAEEDPREQEARKFDLSYVGLTGNIGCMVNGAGLAMATMDIIKLHGAEPANFLDVGGGATTDKITAAFKILLSDKNVKAILINIFGGIVRCNLIAEGILAAVKQVDLHVPLVVRLEGTNAKEGKAILEQSGLALAAAATLEDAAKKVVSLAC